MKFEKIVVAIIAAVCILLFLLLYFGIAAAATWFLCVIFKITFKWIYVLGFLALLEIIGAAIRGKDE